MFAVGLVRDKKGVYSFDIPVPEIRKPNEVLVKVKRVGLDGTDFSMVSEDLKDLAEGRDNIVLGHEMAGVVVAVGRDVKSLKKGDIVTTTVRRGCGECHPCMHNQSDMCMTGLFKERGIHKLDGFLTEYAVDEEQYIVKLPESLEAYVALLEPLSIVEKAVQQIKIIQSRLPWACGHPEHSFLEENWGRCKSGIVIGAGPLGLLATAHLRLAGVNTTTIDIVPEEHIKAALVRQMGANYMDARSRKPEEIVGQTCQAGQASIILEASGASELALNLIPCLLRSSICVMTGIPRGKTKANFDADLLLRQIVRYNIVIVGSVNSNRGHFEKAITSLKNIEQSHKGVLRQFFTHTFKLKDYEKAFMLQDPNRIKVMLDIG